jgi:hypothetical protein
MIEFIKKFYPALVVGAFCLALFMQHLQLRQIQNERDAALIKINLLSSQINQQNEAINEWQSKSHQLQVKLTKVEKESLKKRHLADQEIQKILNKKISSVCTKAIQEGIAIVKQS